MTVGRTWKLWASRYKSGALWHVGARPWVALHGLPDPIVPVLVEEFIGDPYDDSVTHYGWEDAPHRHGTDRKTDVPAMIQIRTGNDPKDPLRARMFLQMCFPYGIEAAVERGDGKVVALRITEQSEEP